MKEKKSKEKIFYQWQFFKKPYQVLEYISTRGSAKQKDILLYSKQASKYNNKRFRKI